MTHLVKSVKRVGRNKRNLTKKASTGEAICHIYDEVIMSEHKEIINLARKDKRIPITIFLCYYGNKANYGANYVRL